MTSMRLGVVAVLMLSVAVVGCAQHERAAPSSTTGVWSPELSVVRGQQVAVATCEMLRGWVNDSGAAMNEAASRAAEAPTEVRAAFAEAILDVEILLRAWPSTVEETIEGAEEIVVALRSDLIRRSAEALEVLADMGELVASWPDDDTETRNARTQQAFIGFEAVMAEMRPDAGPYRGTTLGDAFATEEACELTIRP
jgi:hypothetical protein